MFALRWKAVKKEETDPFEVAARTGIGRCPIWA